MDTVYCILKTQNRFSPKPTPLLLQTLDVSLVQAPLAAWRAGGADSLGSTARRLPWPSLSPREAGRTSPARVPKESTCLRGESLALALPDFQV